MFSLGQGFFSFKSSEKKDVFKILYIKTKIITQNNFMDSKFNNIKIQKINNITLGTNAVNFR